MIRYCCISIVFFLLGCGPTPYYSEELPINNKIWNEELEVVFEIDVVDTVSTYELQLQIEHDIEYRHQNIYLSISTEFPDDKKKEEKLAIDFADKKGNWLGDCGGKTCALTVYLLEAFKFPDSGKYRFGFRQFTREKELKGVEGLQLSLYKSESANK